MYLLLPYFYDEKLQTNGKVERVIQRTSICHCSLDSSFLIFSHNWFFSVSIYLSTYLSIQTHIVCICVYI
jgi:hypothetical protein